MKTITKIMTGVVLGGASVCSAYAAQIQVTMTVDNSYALFTGSSTAATTFVGSDNNWTNAETYNFNLFAGDYIYVVTSSDQSVAQGFLGQFKNLTDNYTFYSQDAQWQVMATGLGGNAPYSGSAADLALLSQQIVLANANATVSNGWTSFTAGSSNGTAPWGTIGGIDLAANWVWYAGGNCDTGNPTLGGCNADEWLVFRIAAAATPEDPLGTVPEPASLSLMGLGILGLSIASARRRMKKA